jgi:hypothetical protein
MTRCRTCTFAPIAHLGDALMAAGFRDPVLDRDAFTFSYPDLPALLRELRALGMTNALAARRRSLTGKGRLAAAQAACETLRRPDGRLPVTWEALYAHAWAPAPGAPIREDGHDVVAVPISAIPIRRRVPKDSPVGTGRCDNARPPRSGILLHPDDQVAPDRAVPGQRALRAFPRPRPPAPVAPGDGPPPSWLRSTC